MIIYQDIFTSDEIIADSYDLRDVNDVVYEVDCSMVTTEPVDVDIGANGSADAGDDEAAEDQPGKVNNIVHAFRLQATTFDKKGYLAYLKGYLQAVKAALQQRGIAADTITSFEQNAQNYVKTELLPKFRDLEFYTGESMNPDGLVVLLNYRSDGITPYVIVWKHGLKGIKV